MKGKKLVLKSESYITETTPFDYENKMHQLISDLNKHDNTIYNLRVQLEQKNIEYQSLLDQYNDIRSSFFWRLTKPVRSIIDLIKHLLKRLRIFRMLHKGLLSLRNEGFKKTWLRTKLYFENKKILKLSLKNHIEITKAERQLQRNKRFVNNVKFSIIVPLYNTPKIFLIEMLESVIKQTYSNWELCLADGSSSGYEYIEKICMTYKNKNKHIHYKKLPYNGGISYNTNQALSLATGDYIGLLDHDDLLHPSLLYEIMQIIDTKNADFIYTDEMTFEGNISNPITMHFKPDYAIDNLRANNYICHFTCFSRPLLKKAGWFRSEYDGSQDYDMVLRLTENASRIVHIPKLLYYWRSHANSVASNIDVKPYCITAAKSAISEHLKRSSIIGEVVNAPKLSTIYRIIYKLYETPLISIIIPNKDNKLLLKNCIDSIIEKTTYNNWEIIVVENNSVLNETFAYYDELKKDNRIRIINWCNGFNYSAINNFGAKYANGKFLLLLNNDICIITPNWIEEMLMFAQRNDVGAVGAKLYYQNDTIQHAGVVIGIMGTAGHVFYHAKKDNLGYMGRLYYAQNYSAVTAACMMVKKDLYLEVNGFSEEFAVAYNDIDFCLKLRKLNKLICFTPFAELYHYESLTRGIDKYDANKKRLTAEENIFKNKWSALITAGDPYYNPNFSLERPDFFIRLKNSNG